MAKSKANKSKGEDIRFSNFSHATKHFVKSKHQLDPNLDLKHLVYHSTKQYVDRDADGDIDSCDRNKTPDEATGLGNSSKKLIAKQKSELKHTRRGVAYEEILVDYENKIFEGKRRGLWDNIRAKRNRGERPARPGEKGYPETLDIGEGLAQAKKNVGATKCWDGKKIGTPPTKIKGGKEVPNCVDESLDIKGKKEPVRYCPRCGKDETRSECKYGENYWDMFSLPSSLTPNSLKFDIAQVHPTNEEKDHEHSMARAEISKIISAARRLRGKVKGEGNLPAWVQSKITRAADYIDTAADYADSGEMHESVHYIIEALDKAKMKCNSPKAQAHGSGEQGKSHVVKACEGGKEKIIRFGQVGVKGSPKKKGESEEYANRRERFKARHAKNIAKGKMSAAYWADKVKW